MTPRVRYDLQISPSLAGNLNSDTSNKCIWNDYSLKTKHFDFNRCMPFLCTAELLFLRNAVQCSIEFHPSGDAAERHLWQCLLDEKAAVPLPIQMWTTDWHFRKCFQITRAEHKHMNTRKHSFMHAHTNTPYTHTHTLRGHHAPAPILCLGCRTGTVQLSATVVCWLCRDTPPCGTLRRILRAFITHTQSPHTVSWTLSYFICAAL